MALVGLGFLAPIPERFRFTDSEEAQEGTAAVETIEGQTTPVEIEAIGSDDQQEDTAPLEQVVETSEVEAGSSEVEISIPENAGTDDP